VLYLLHLLPLLFGFFFRLSILHNIKVPINISLELEGKFAIDTNVTGIFRGEGYQFLLNNKLFKDTFRINITDYHKTENQDTITYFVSKNNIIDKINSNYLNKLSINLIDIAIDSLIFDILNLVEKDLIIQPNYEITLSGNYNLRNIKVYPSKVKVLLKKSEADTINYIPTELFYIDNINKRSDTVPLAKISDKYKLKKPINKVIVNYDIYKYYDTVFSYTYNNRTYDFNIYSNEPVNKNLFNIKVSNDTLFLEPHTNIQNQIIKIDPSYYYLK